MKDILNQTWQRLYAEKKKFYLVCGLLLVGLLLWGRLLFKEVPRTATAEPQAATSQLASATQALDAPPEPIARGQRVELNPNLQLNRDLFEINPDRYKQTQSTRKSMPKAKSASESDDTELRMQSVRDQARRLSLQSVIGGEQPRAFINGRLLKAGATIDGFTVVDINQRHVVLERNGLKVRLGM